MIYCFWSSTDFLTYHFDSLFFYNEMLHGGFFPPFTKGLQVTVNKLPRKFKGTHNFPIYDEIHTQLLKQAHQDNSSDTPQPICECQVDFPLLWIKVYPNPQ